MKIKKLSINGFRSLKDLAISFEEDITVIVGENDSGKTSLIDCLKIVTQNKSVELDDFNYDSNKIELQIEIEDLVFIKVYEKDGEAARELPLEAKPTREFLEKTQRELSAEGFDISQAENIEKIKLLAKLFNVIVKSNSIIANLKKSILEKINQSLEDPNFKIDDAKFPSFNNIQLDGKQFENVTLFFKEVFLKEKQSSIWKEEVEPGTTIESFIKTRIDSYSEEITSKMNDTGMKDKIKLFLKNLTDIRIEPFYQTKDLNIDAKVKFLEGGKEINLQKKGDGTKRRITMALLELKKEQTAILGDNTTIYLLDEPDTHLHVKAQVELMETLQSFAKNGSQVILTTHSPFLINSVKPNQIRLFLSEGQNQTKVKHLHKDSLASSQILHSIGVENIYLFFARIIVIVEGETEEAFIKDYFFRKTGRTLNSSLVKIINVQGVKNIYGFSKGILELHDPRNIYLVFDNDASDDIKEVIRQLNISEDQKHIIGNKEFEDAFSDETLFNCWKKYHEDSNRSCPDNWSTENISQIREECKTNDNKFSEKLRTLNCGGKKMTKPIFGNALAQYIEEEKVPLSLSELIQKLCN
jgi:predicted ATP-dependent endonuclease of OLD family